MKVSTSKVFTGLLFSLIFFVACNDDDVPPAENEEEIIDKVTLTFTAAAGSPIIVEALDPDGQGAANFDTGTINLNVSTTYVLTILVENSNAQEDITAEISEEAEEHMFFFSFTSGAFSDPAGDGNIDNRSDAVNYNDLDGNGNPLGLNTTWTTATSSTVSGELRLILKHQPDTKSSTSGSLDGETDIDITFPINIE